MTRNCDFLVIDTVQIISVTPGVPLSLGLGPRFKAATISCWSVALETSVANMAMLDIKMISPQMNSNFYARILNYKIVDEGKFAVFTIQITVDGYTWTVERRYSEFDAMDMRRFPDRKKSFLPPKRLIRNLDSEFLEERRAELEKYCRALLELEVWCQKQKKVNSLPLLTAKFFDFHQYPCYDVGIVYSRMLTDVRSLRPPSEVEPFVLSDR
ncbi:hypothetical protein KIN20_010631 [Parelaphostrongylus tenuis]|uniref:PX domain-containing protein n=1 Tax=Parelaphostrongylus tenuis TaxID=148309 RepID=A0AAD5M854_PARTN|nr:hypothetical protein KIN20_010631 [Parelaphostrongylus tenuis]